MASTVFNGNDRSEKWHRPFQMATTVYEREICGGDGDGDDGGGGSLVVIRGFPSYEGKLVLGL